MAIKKITIKVAVARGETEGHFKGTVTFKDDEYKEILYNFLIINPDDQEVDAKFWNDTDSFHLKGMPSEALIASMTERQRLILSLSFEIMNDAIAETQKLSLSQQTTNLLREYGGDVSGGMQTSCNLNDEAHNALYG